ncbi:MAG: 2-polyprenylphenol 6-hydroxylase [Pseudomonadota bacterium]
MAILSDIWRLVRLAATFRRTGALPHVLEAMGVAPRDRVFLQILATPLWPLGLRGEPSLPPVTRAASALGPSYVKFGQILSTRPDIAGDELVKDLRNLQDRLPPFSNEEARRMVEEQLGKPIDQLFEKLDPPIAAASIAQVHPAIDKDGRKVAVKVLRPGIERAFSRDISAFYFVARTLERFRAKSRRLRPTAVVKHFEGVVTREMDLRLEAAAGSEYGDNIRDEKGFRTPDIIWSLSAKRVLTTGWVDGTRMADLDELKARGLDLPEMALRMVRLFLRCALRDGYFHADMHQGNLKVAPDGAVVAFDFGIMGRIDRKTRRTYAEILYAYINRDYERGAEAHFDAGYVPRTHNKAQFAQALRSIGEPIVGQKASDISMARVLQQLFDVTERFGMETRPELILLQRTMVVVEGVARSLDPDFDMWKAARPVVEDWVRDNLGPRAALKDLTETANRLTRLRPYLPDLADRLLEFVTDYERNGAGSNGAEPLPQPGPSRFWPGVALGAVLAACIGAVAVIWADELRALLQLSLSL